MLVSAASHLVVSNAVQRQIVPKPQRIKCLGMDVIHLTFHIL